MTTIPDIKSTYKTWFTWASLTPAQQAFATSQGYSSGSVSVAIGDVVDYVTQTVASTQTLLIDANGDPICFWGLNGCGVDLDTFGVKSAVDVCGGMWAGADSSSQILPIYTDSTNKLVAKAKAEQTISCGGSETYQATTIALNTVGIKTMTSHSILINNPSACLPMKGLANFENTFEVELDAFTGLTYRPVITVNGGTPTPDAARFKIYGSYFFDDYANHNINPYTIPAGGSLSLVNQSTINVSIPQPGSLWYASNASVDWIFVNE